MRISRSSATEPHKTTLARQQTGSNPNSKLKLQIQTRRPMRLVTFSSLHGRSGRVWNQGKYHEGRRKLECVYMYITSKRRERADVSTLIRRTRVLSFHFLPIPEPRDVRTLVSYFLKFQAIKFQISKGKMYPVCSSKPYQSRRMNGTVVVVL
jgi:hypothetical protein